MRITELNRTIESWSYIEDKLRRARNRENFGSDEWTKFDTQLGTVSRHIDKLVARRDDLMTQVRLVAPRPVRFFSIEAV